MVGIGHISKDSPALFRKVMKLESNNVFGLTVMGEEDLTSS